MGRQHGTLAKAGKVRKQTPKVVKPERTKQIIRGRSYKRMQYNRRFASLVVGDAKKKQRTPNWHAGRKDILEAELKKEKEMKEMRKNRN